MFRGIILATLLLIGFVSGAQDMFGQDFTPEMREKFIADQEVYFQELNLADNQKRSYEEITRRYDKEIQNLGWSGIVRKLKKKRMKGIKKAKNKEMKALLATDQYKLYLRRQRQIENDYNQ